MDYLAFAQAIVANLGAIKGIIDAASANNDIVTKVKAIAGPAASVLEYIGASFFPKVAPELRVAAAVMAAFDPAVTKWVQGGLNSLVTPSPGLVVDGIYGPHTRAAVEALQAQVGLTVDGWAGQITQATIAKLLGGK